MASRPPFDPSFDPRETAELLRGVAGMLSAQSQEREGPSTFDVSEYRQDVARILAYARAWAEHQGYPRAGEIPDSVDSDLSPEEFVRLLTDAAELLGVLARAHDRRSWN